MARKKGLGRGLSALIPSAKIEKKQVVDSGTSEEQRIDERIGEKKSTAKSAAQKAEKKVQKETEATAVAPNRATSQKTRSAASKKSEKVAPPRANQKRIASGVAKEAADLLQMLPISAIEPNPEQPRKEFAEAALQELSVSIQKYGVLQPIIVKKYTAPGRAPYEIIAGERRFRAAKMAGLEEIPAVLRQEDTASANLLSVIENVQREDLNPLEEALAYRRVQETQGLTQQELADALGKSRSYIANTVRLLNLDPESLEALRQGLLTASQGRSLLGESDLTKRKKYREMMIRGLTNVNAVEKKTAKRPSKKRDLYLEDWEERLTEILATKVSIAKRRKGYDLRVQCATREALEDLLARLSEEDV